ncbi:MAG: hypothetical protein L3K14_07840 [Thermoplasmata archaeon]|nr:hypothetical protein [Thermoplasmata archaeon]
MQLRSSIKAFAAKPLGRIALLLFISLALAGSSIYLGYLIAIPVFLLTGLGLPIYLGWNRPRTLFLVGLAALLVAGPIVTAGTVNLLLTPSPAVNGVVFAPHTQSVLQNATVHPYSRAAAGNFTFTVEVTPAFLPNGSGPKVLVVVFFLTTCPDALTYFHQVLVRNHNSSCGAPGSYPFFSSNFSYNGSTPTPVTFVAKVGGVNVWWWTIGVSYLNSSGKVAWLYLLPPNGYTTAEGPVTGEYLSLYLLILPAIYFTVFIYPGLVFFIGLLVYFFLKSRQRRRAGGAPAVAVPQTSAIPTRPGGGTGSTAPTSPPSRPELACPKCGAVVYKGESRCWKCGTPLTSTETPPADQPLQSS